MSFGWLKHLDWIVLALAVGLVLISVYRAHRDPSNNINLLDLLLENGRMSRLAVGFMAALGLSTWIMVHLTLHEKMTEGYFWAFGSIWVGPIVAKLVFNKAEPPAPQAKP